MARIAVHMPTLAARGGAERYAAEVAAVFRDHGHDVALAAIHNPDLREIGDYFDVDLTGVDVIQLPGLGRLERIRPRRRAWQLRDAVWARNLRMWGPDIMVNAVYRSELVLPGTRHVTVCHFPHHVTSTLQADKRDWQLSRLLTPKRLFPPAGSLTIANSEFTRSHVRRRWGVDATVIYPPCPMVGPSAGPRDRTILAVGRFTAPQPRLPNKRFDIMLDVFSRLHDVHEMGYRLQLIGSAGEGDVSYVEDLRQRARGLPVDIIVNAPYDKLRSAYQKADVYWHAQGYGEDINTHPEAHEHFGMSTVEAMSAGVIPIVIGTAGPLEVVAPLEAALTWTTTDGLAQVTREVVSLPESQRQELRASVLERAQAFSRHAFSSRVDHVLGPYIRD